MLSQQEAQGPGGPDAPARPVPDPQSRRRRRRLTDRLTRVLVRLGGVIVIGSILAILLVIVIEIAPLSQGARVGAAGLLRAPLHGPTLALGTDEYRELFYAVTSSGLRMFSAAGGAPSRLDPAFDLGEATVAGVSDRGGGRLALGLSDGRAIAVEIAFRATYVEGNRSLTPEIRAGRPIQVDPARQPLRILSYATGEAHTLVAAVVGPRAIAAVVQRRKKSLVGDEKVEETRHEIELPGGGEIRALAVDGRGDDLFAGLSTGELVRVDFRDPEQPRVAETAPVCPTAITALAFLIGDRTLVVGDALGGLATWQLLRVGEGGFVLSKLHDFPSHAAAVLSLSHSERDKGFVSADAQGTVHLNYGTTGKRLLALPEALPGLERVVLAPKANGIAAIGTEGRLMSWPVHNAHPEISLDALFSKLPYEGYQKPDHVWQSTGGTDDFESKFGLTKLVFGTLKGTCYALLIAVPLALLSALYVSQFMHPSLRGYVKPVVEVMAALPSVVLGFIAGLWLAPRIEKVVPGLFLAPLIVGALTLGSVAAWRALPLRFRRRVKPGTEIALLLPLVLAGGWLSMLVGGLLEQSLLGGDFRPWLHEVFGLTYDQKNCIVVGLAMGFAVIPIIFTITEDSLSNVPAHLSAGSLALGATAWQTAVRVVLPTASPGIFSAVMIGFGRAVGETMIVLMATGNTPIMDLSIFNGFRALSANIAVELSEAPEGGTLYRVLFLAAFLLFVMTFAVNTLAEAVRLRLRRRYQTL
jgi:phosphate transport system permease protein